MAAKTKNKTQDTDIHALTISFHFPMSENDLLDYARNNSVISAVSLQRKFKIGYHTATNALKWLIIHHKATPLQISLPIYTT